MNNDGTDINLLIDYYLSELYNLSLGVVTLYPSIERLLENYSLEKENVYVLRPNQEPDQYFFVEPRVFPLVSSILIYAADIRKLLYKYEDITDNKKIQRIEALQEYFDMGKLDEIFNQHVRNSIQHFDEKLDIAANKLYKGTFNKKYDLIAANTILSSENSLGGVPYYLKCYILDTQTFHNVGKKANIKKIFNEASYILETLDKKMDRHPQSASVIPIPKK